MTWGQGQEASRVAMVAGSATSRIASAEGRRATDRYFPVLALGYAGYVVMGKSFAYLGVPPLYMGEILFGLGLLALLASGSMTALLTTGPALIALTLFGWVLFRTLQGFGEYGIDALRDGVVAIYAGFAFFVAALMLERPARLAQIMGYLRVLSRVVLPVAIICLFIARAAGESLPSIPGQEGGFLSVRGGELATHLCAGVVLAVLGLCRVGRLWILAAIAAALLISSQTRGGMLALVIPIVFAMLLTGQLGRLVAIAGIVGFGFALAYAADLTLEIGGNERVLSARALADNMASIFTSNDTNNLDGTKQWRLDWWAAIRNYTFSGPYFWTGKGFGMSLAFADGFVVGLENAGPPLRSPHNIHMTYLGRAGVPGLVLWVLTFASWMAVLLITARKAHLRGERDWSRFFIFLVCYLASMVIDATFDVALEGPMLGIPFWIIFGVGLGSLMIYRGIHAVEKPLRMRPLRRQVALHSLLMLAALAWCGVPRADASEGEGCPQLAVRIRPGASIQAAVDAAAPRATFCIEPGLHRGQRVAPKDGQIFIGLPGAVMSGAESLADFRQEGAFWSAAISGPPMRPLGTCLKSRPLCNQPLRIFMDDQPLEPAELLAELRPGAVFHDAARGRVYLADDPGGRNVEYTRRSYAFWSNRARDVVVRGLVVEKYATPAQQGAIFGDADPRATGWLIENNEVRLNSGAGIATGARAIVRGNRIHHNGQLGIAPDGNDVLIEDNEIYDNNTHGYDASWEAGGLKAAVIERLTLRRNRVHGNLGSGLWCDIDCRDVLIEDNIVERNADAGIFYEISYDAVIRNNVVRLNGTRSAGQQGSVWFWGAGIQIAASQGVEVYGNTVTVAEGSSGIMLIDQGRDKGPGTAGMYRTTDNIVRDNTVIYQGRNGTSGGASDVRPQNPNFGIIEAGGNRFDRNTYVRQPDAAERGFIWGKQPITYDEFRSQGQEKDGRLVRGDPAIVPPGAKPD
jgi:parallel beta-helix repeat protein